MIVPKSWQSTAVFQWMRKSYQAVLHKRLAKYGLRQDDLYDPVMDEDAAEALRRLPPHLILQRNARLRRALDLDMKHVYLEGELLKAQTPGQHYMRSLLEEVRAERRERAMLGASAAWQQDYKLG